MATDTALLGRPAKLRNGGWGAYFDFDGEPPEVGDLATVRAASGRTWDVRIEAVIWLDATTALCETVELSPEPPRIQMHATPQAALAALFGGGGYSTDNRSAARDIYGFRRTGYPYDEPNHDCMGDFGDW